MRDRKGKLLRKKRVSIEKEKKSQEVEKTSDLLLRKLGILSTKEIADHNFEIVTKRKSDYEFADLQK